MSVPAFTEDHACTLTSEVARKEDHTVSCDSVVVTAATDIPTHTQECVGTYACLSTLKDGIQVPHVPEPHYSAPLMNIGVGPTVSAGGRQSFGPLPDFLRSYHIQYFTDSGGQRWREGGGLTLTLSMGGVCAAGGGDRGGAHGAGGQTYQETRVYLVCSLMAGKGQPELMEMCGDKACAALPEVSTRHDCSCRRACVRPDRGRR